MPSSVCRQDICVHFSCTTTCFVTHFPALIPSLLSNEVSHPKLGPELPLLHGLVASASVNQKHTSTTCIFYWVTNKSITPYCCHRIIVFPTERTPNWWPNSFNFSRISRLIVEFDILDDETSPSNLGEHQRMKSNKGIYEAMMQRNKSFDNH